MLAEILLTIFSVGVCVATSRLFLHPLRGFPGPPLAALTRWYQAYYDIIKQGSLLRQVNSLHEKYGAIVRIGPNELSFNDPRAYSDIYAIGSKFTKEPNFYACFGLPQASFGTIDPHTSRTRREMLAPFFSRHAIMQLEGVVQAKVDQFVMRLASQGKLRKPVNLSMAFRCTTLEIITEYCLDQSLNALDAPDFQDPFIMSLKSAIPFYWVLKYFSILTPIVMDPPEWLFSLMTTKARGLFDFRRQIAVQLDSLLANPDLLRDADHKIIYHYLLAPSNNLKEIPPLSRDELFQEALALLLAGSDTVGNVCTVGFVHILENPPVLRNLMAELEEIWPDKNASIDYAILEKLPYLTAVIKESLRFGHGAVSALPRVVGPKDAVIGGVCVPAGTIVSMSQTYLHLDKKTFDKPLEFIPERWLGQDRDRKALDAWLVPFSRGPRMCLGMNLAWGEMYRIFGNVLRKFDLTLHNTTSKDYDEFDAFFVPIHRGNELHVTVQAK